MLPIAQGGAVGLHQLHEGHGENLLAFVFSWERQKHGGGEGSVGTARGAVGRAGRGSPSCACHQSAAGRWCGAVGAAGSTVGSRDGSRDVSVGSRDVSVCLEAAAAAARQGKEGGREHQQQGRAERGGRGPCEDSAGLGAGGVWLVQDQACEHPTQLQVPAAPPCRGENPGAWDFQLHQAAAGSTSAPGRTLQPTASPQPKATRGRADAKHRAQGAAWQRCPGDLLPRHGQLGLSKAGTTARLLLHENPGVTAHPGCPHGSGTGTRTAREVLPSLQPRGHPPPLQPWQGTRAEERVKERCSQSLEERCLKVNLRWVLWTSSMGTAI